MSLDVERRMEAFHGRGKSLCVRCTLLTTSIFPSYILKLHPGLLNPPLQLLPPPVLLRVTKPPRSVFKTKISDTFYKNCCHPLTDSSCVSLVCTCGRACAVPPGVADAVGHGGGKTRVVSARERLEVVLHKPLPPPHLVHTLHTETKGKSENFTQERNFFCVCWRSLFPVNILDPASPFPGYDRKVFMFPDVQPKNSHVYDYFPISKAIIQVSLVS